MNDSETRSVDGATPKKTRNIRSFVFFALALISCLGLLGIFYYLEGNEHKIEKRLILEGIDHTESWISAMNGKGQLAGTYKNPQGEKCAFIWTPGKGVERIGPIGSREARIELINEDGDLYGMEGSRLFRWTSGKGLESLDILKSDDLLDPVFIRMLNVSRGEVVAFNIPSYGKGVPERAFVWSKEKGFQNIGNLGGGKISISSMNKRGQLAGCALTANGDDHAFLWSQETGLQDLGAPSKLKCWTAYIDEQGKILGWARDAKDNTHLYTWSKEEGFKDLGTLGSRAPSELKKRGITHTMGELRQLRGICQDEAANTTGLYFWTKAGGTRRVAEIRGLVDHRFTVTGDDAIIGVTGTSQTREEVFYATKDSVRYLGIMEGFPQSGGYYITPHGVLAGNVMGHQGVPWWLNLQNWLAEKLNLPDKYKPDLNPYAVRGAYMWKADLGEATKEPSDK